MKPTWIAGSVLLGTALMAGCSERNTPTAVRNQPGIAFDAASLTSVVTDPVGDAGWNENSGPGSLKKAPAWLDLASASVALQGSRFLFAWDLAAPVPSDPAADSAIPAHSDHVCIGRGLDTDPATAPVGYPNTQNESDPVEFYVALCWNPTGSFGLGTGFVGLLMDRRPLLAGDPAVVTQVDFHIDGQQVVIAVDAAALGEPATFAWVAFTEVANQADPNDARKILDFAPDAGLATWPQ